MCIRDRQKTGNQMKNPETRNHGSQGVKNYTLSREQYENLKQSLEPRQKDLISKYQKELPNKQEHEVYQLLKSCEFREQVIEAEIFGEEPRGNHYKNSNGRDYGSGKNRSTNLEQNDSYFKKRDNYEQNKEYRGGNKNFGRYDKNAENLEKGDSYSGTDNKFYRNDIATRGPNSYRGQGYDREGNYSKKYYNSSKGYEQEDTSYQRQGSYQYNKQSVKRGPIQQQSSQQKTVYYICLLYTSPSPRDRQKSRMPSSA
eukprot:TRINITY_DN4527_c0_g3_i1.p2 TRINITY_DN4527_c0_g3~~TRINITY_DN4527_c0_g3_i1.p2  ORF type:complete len:256 (+),score=39.31 TRINITY_DN4527_c0_g3_i1:66-833(+)